MHHYEERRKGNFPVSVDKPKQSSLRGILLHWIALTTLGHIVGLVLAYLVFGLTTLLVSEVPQSFVPLLLLSFPLSGALPGAAVGAGQWWALRHVLAGSGWWIAASALASAAAALLSPFIGLEIPPLQQTATERVLPGTLTILVGGLLGGIGQWQVLRRVLPGAVWWIGINMLGWGLGGLAFFGGFAWLLVNPSLSAVVSYVPPGWLVALLYSIASLALLPAFITGAGIVWLLRQSQHRA
jgi:hypothetical protein